jgi:hypothetical protein
MLLQSWGILWAFVFSIEHKIALIFGLAATYISYLQLPSTGAIGYEGQPRSFG